MAKMFLPKTIPTDFAGDFKTPSTRGDCDEGLVQCCQYPSRRDKHKDNSTIIEFVHIPVEKKGDLIRNCGSQGRKRSSKNKGNYYDQMTMTESRQQPTVLYHHHLGAQYLGIHQPHNVVTTQNALLSVTRKDSAMSTGSDYPADYSSSSMSSTASIPSVSTSTLSGAGGFKYKTHLLSRYSSDLEEENRLLKQIISLQITSESDSGGSNSGHSFRRFTPEAARTKIREISRDMEQKKRRAEGRDGVGTDDSVSTAEVQDFANGDTDIPRTDNGENMNEMEISSEFSFTSGYRSSEFLSDQSSEELEEELEEEQDDVLSNDEKRAVEVCLERKNKRSILKARKLKLPGLSVTSPALEDLPDLESVNSKIPASHQTSRKVIFLDEKGKILATSGAEDDDSLAVIRKIPKDFEVEQSLMKKLKVLSDAGLGGKQSADLTFVDLTGRVLATSSSTSSSRLCSPGTAPQRKVTSSLLGSVLPLPPGDQQEEEEISPHLTTAWLQLRKISRNLEQNKIHKSEDLHPPNITN